MHVDTPPLPPSGVRKHGVLKYSISMSIRSTKGIKKKIDPQIGHLENRLRNGWRKRQLTLVVSHKARP
jgi:hypothetical protein